MSKKLKSMSTVREAFDVLSAAAKEQKGEVLSVLEDDYKDLKETFNDLRPKIGQQLHEVKGKALDEMKRREDDLLKMQKELRADVEKKVREEPVKTLAWTALGAFVVGILFGSKK